MITFDTYALDRVIDERIESAFELGSVYGADLFDEEGKVGYHRIGFQPGHLIDVLQNQQNQITELEDKISNLYNEINNLYKTKEERNE
jgi:hypothetical protein